MKRWSHFGRIKTFGLFLGLSLFSFLSYCAVISNIRTEPHIEKQDKVTVKSKPEPLKTDTTEEARLYEKAKNLQAIDLRANYKAYSELAELNPDEKIYRDRRDVYKKKLETYHTPEKEFEYYTELSFPRNLIKSARLSEGTGIISFKEKADYFGTGDKINKIFAIESVRLFRSMDWVSQLKLTIPLTGKKYILEITRKQAEKYYNINIPELKDMRQWDKFIQKHHNKESRKKFSAKFSRVR
ncbi:MAG: hypothetical protein GY749_46580 [Desulfobacteraceae bacterium]|nr:hypothetical protein [Desulfobacteraceae bacterium]